MTESSFEIAIPAPIARLEVRIKDGALWESRIAIARKLISLLQEECGVAVEIASPAELQPGPFQIRIGKNGAHVQFAETELTPAIERVEIRRPLDSAEYEFWLRVKADLAIDKNLDMPGAPATCIAEISDEELFGTKEAA